MSGGAEAALEAAVLGMLQANADVRAALGDPVRRPVTGADKPAYPFVEIVRHECEDAGASGVEASRHRLDLQIMFRDGPRTEVASVLGHVRSALAGLPPEMAGWRAVMLAPAFWDMAQQPFGGWRALVRVRALLEPD